MRSLLESRGVAGRRRLEPPSAGNLMTCNHLQPATVGEMRRGVSAQRVSRLGESRPRPDPGNVATGQRVSGGHHVTGVVHRDGARRRAESSASAAIEAGDATRDSVGGEVVDGHWRFPTGVLGRRVNRDLLVCDVAVMRRPQGWGFSVDPDARGIGLKGWARELLVVAQLFELRHGKVVRYRRRAGRYDTIHLHRLRGNRERTRMIQLDAAEALDLDLERDDLLMRAEHADRVRQEFAVGLDLPKADERTGLGNLRAPVSGR